MAHRDVRLPLQGKVCALAIPRAALEASLPLGLYPSARFGAEEGGCERSHCSALWLAQSMRFRFAQNMPFRVAQVAEGRLRVAIGPSP